MPRTNPLAVMHLNYGFHDPRYPSHEGADFRASTGTKVRAAAAGVAKPYVGTNGGGNVIQVTHSDGSRAYYSHLSKWLVKRGQKVKAGQVIGLSGATGHATGPHLHFAVMNPAGRWIDPVKWLAAEILPAYYHVAGLRKGEHLNGRTGPSLKARIKVRRRNGVTLKIVRWVSGGGFKWGVTQFGTHYAKQFLKPGK